MEGSAQRQQRDRITATSLIRQLEQGATQPPTSADHVQRLKLQATAKHVHKLLATLDERAASVLRIRLAKAEAALDAQVPKPPPATSTSSSIPASSSAYDLDFLAPTAPLPPRSRPSSPSASSNYSNAYPGAGLDSPSQSYGYGTSDADASFVSTASTNRSMRSSSISGLDDYEPDAYSPTRSRAGSSISRPPPSMVETSDGEGAGRRRRDEEDEYDPEAGFGSGGVSGPRLVVNGEDRVDPEASFDLPPRRNDDDDFDPEAGGMDFVRPSSRGSNRSLQHAPPPPPRRSSISSNHSGARLSPQSSLRQRPSAAPRSRFSDDAARDRDDLLSGQAQASTSDLLSHHHDMQNSLMSSLTSLSSQLKQSSLAFGENLEKDKAVMENAQGKLETNYDGMKKTSGKLGTVKKKTRGTTCWTLGVVAVVGVAWVMMFFLIKVT